MMYVFWFLEFLFNLFTTPLRLISQLVPLLIDVVEHLFNFISVFPVWLSYPLYVLACLALVFRISQFIPTIGGAS